MTTTMELSSDQTSRVEFGPVFESTEFISGLDYYKPTMSQLAFERKKNAEVTFSFHNRGEQRLADYIDAERLQDRFDQLQSNGFSVAELGYLSDLKKNDGSAVFSSKYINYLATNELPKVNVLYDDEIDDIAIDTTGDWALVTFWETVVMSEVNEAYFEGYLVKNNIDPIAVYEEGDRRLTEKIKILQKNPQIQFSDFGTRRHFSSRWQKHVVERIKNECPNNFTGTSNVAFSKTLGMKPIGTFAHEMPMVYAALADANGEDVRASHHQFLEDYYNYYGEEYSTALTDTFTTDFFFEDFTPEQAKNWIALRQDSGNPFDFGEEAIDFYDSLEIDPMSKRIVFSDGLDIGPIVDLDKRFNGRINAAYGWGTTLTNDLGIQALNVVMKATHVKDPETGNETDTVKLSDDPGKNLGPAWLVKNYFEKYFNSRKGKQSWN